VPESIYDDTAMAELVVVGFKNDISRAAAVLGELRAADEPWTRGLHGAIATYREHGQLTIDQSYESTKGNAVIGGSMIGSLVGLALAAIALPITAGISGVVAAGTLAAGAIGGSIVGAHHNEQASWWKDDVKVPEPFLDNVRACVLDGDSAIFFLLRSPTGIDFAERFDTHGRADRQGPRSTRDLGPAPLIFSGSSARRHQEATYTTAWCRTRGGCRSSSRHGSR